MLEKAQPLDLGSPGSRPEAHCFTGGDVPCFTSEAKSHGTEAGLEGTRKGLQLVDSMCLSLILSW